jgi:hypothetical protein
MGIMKKFIMHRKEKFTLNNLSVNAFHKRFPWSLNVLMETFYI